MLRNCCSTLMTALGFLFYNSKWTSRTHVIFFAPMLLHFSSVRPQIYLVPLNPSNKMVEHLQDPMPWMPQLQCCTLHGSSGRMRKRGRKISTRSPGPEGEASLSRGRASSESGQDPRDPSVSFLGAWALLLTSGRPLACDGQAPGGPLSGSQRRHPLQWCGALLTGTPLQAPLIPDPVLGAPPGDSSQARMFPVTRSLGGSQGLSGVFTRPSAPCLPPPLLAPADGPAGSPSPVLSPAAASPMALRRAPGSPDRPRRSGSCLALIWFKLFPVVLEVCKMTGSGRLRTRCVWHVQGLGLGSSPALRGGGSREFKASLVYVGQSNYRTMSFTGKIQV